MRGRIVAAVLIALLVGPARLLLHRSMMLEPMTPEALLIVTVGVGLFVWWLGSLYDREVVR